MSGFTHENFVEEFAYRTMVNYYLFKDYADNTNKVLPKKILELKDIMENKGFDASLKYEVTLALNSMLGLLVFPQQSFYNAIAKTRSFEGLKTLEKHMKLSYRCCENIYTPTTPGFVIKKMRNAVCHERIMVYPASASNSKITHITFRDVSYRDYDRWLPFSFENEKTLDEQIKEKRDQGIEICDFMIKIPVEDIEQVLMEIANFMINAKYNS